MPPRPSLLGRGTDGVQARPTSLASRANRRFAGKGKSGGRDVSLSIVARSYKRRSTAAGHPRASPPSILWPGGAYPGPDLTCPDWYGMCTLASIPVLVLALASAFKEERHAMDCSGSRLGGGVVAFDLCGWLRCGRLRPPVGGLLRPADAWLSALLLRGPDQLPTRGAAAGRDGTAT